MVGCGRAGYLEVVEGVHEAGDHLGQPPHHVLPPQVVEQGRHVGVAVGHQHHPRVAPLFLGLLQPGEEGVQTLPEEDERQACREAKSAFKQDFESANVGCTIL